jgi:hypothetical protein
VIIRGRNELGGAEPGLDRCSCAAETLSRCTTSHPDQSTTRHHNSCSTSIEAYDWSSCLLKPLLYAQSRARAPYASGRSRPAFGSDRVESLTEAGTAYGSFH